MLFKQHVSVNIMCCQIQTLTAFIDACCCAYCQEGIPILVFLSFSSCRNEVAHYFVIPLYGYSSRQLFMSILNSEVEISRQEVMVKRNPLFRIHISIGVMHAQTRAPTNGTHRHKRTCKSLRTRTYTVLIHDVRRIKLVYMTIFR